MNLRPHRLRSGRRSLVLVSALAAALGAVGSTLVAGPDVRINSITAEDQAEAQIVVSPTNPMNLFAAWRDLRAGRAAIGFAASLDGGATWTQGIYDDPDADLLYDPSVAADAEGNFYLTFGRDLGTLFQARLLKSVDGGASFGPVTIVGPFVDKEFMAIDRSSGAIYVAGTAALKSGGALFITRSTDGGASFGPLTLVSRNGGNVNSPAFGPNGEVYLCSPTFSGKGVKVLFNRSFDGGATWMMKDVQVASFKSTPSLLNGNVNAPHLVTLASDRSGGPFNGSLYVVWHAGGAGGEDVFLSLSRDGGTTWSAPARVNDDPLDSPADQFLPWVNVDDAGRVHVTFLDRREDPANVNFGFFLATSTDGGVTFAPNVRISDGTFPPSPATIFVGDYNAPDTDAGALHAIWADGRDGDLDIFYERVPMP